MCRARRTLADSWLGRAAAPSVAQPNDTTVCAGPASSRSAPTVQTAPQSAHRLELSMLGVFAILSIQNRRQLASRTNRFLADCSPIYVYIAEPVLCLQRLIDPASFRAPSLRSSFASPYRWYRQSASRKYIGVVIYGSMFKFFSWTWTCGQPLGYRCLCCPGWRALGSRGRDVLVRITPERLLAI